MDTPIEASMLLTTMDISAIRNGSAKAVVLASRPDDLYLLEEWMPLADAFPPLAVHGVCQYNQEVFEVGETVHISDLLRNVVTATVTAITLLTPSMLTVDQRNMIGYTGQILLPLFKQNRIWFVEIRDVRPLRQNT